MEVESWFKLKKYPHVGLPITIKDYKKVKGYIEDESKIKKHSFLPLIHKCISQRKYRADKKLIEKNPSGKRKRIKDKKDRHIYYASHLDSLIFSYYNNLLVEAYKSYIETKDFNDSIVAYRKIPMTEGSKNNKCNIDFAKTTFKFIEDNKSKKLTVIIADVTSFFDNLNHKILKKQWSKIIEKTTLPEDHYNIFKALTRIKYIEGNQLYKSYGKTMLVESGISNSSKGTEYKRKFISKIKYFKEKNAVAYCDKKDFINNNLNLVISKNNKVGIPQGSPISATLANVYMLDFDEIIFGKVKSINGYYQRYSDDLVIVCEQKHEDEVIKTLRENISNVAKLEIHPSKTKVFHFEDVNGKFTGFEINEVTKQPNYNKTLEYLGFSYDGQRVLVKTSGFSKFYRSMIKSYKKSASFAEHSKNPDKRIFKSKLYKRFTHIGAKRKLIYHPMKDDKTKYVKTKKYSWGNYLSYINKAEDTMRTINKSNSIKKQSRKLWRYFHLQMKKYTN
ncbi:MAG: hypothetical protein JXR82_01150 [Marinifilaceae bacterium]|nr:hypothetical protein [Marinifilaceae bacterium]